MNKHPLLEAIDLKKAFLGPHKSSLAILEGISLKIRQGESISIRGESGCGKSTLLHVLSMLLTPDSGTLLWEDQNPLAWSQNAIADFRKRFMGFIFQSHTLIPELNAYENVLMARHLLHPIQREDHTIVQNLLENVGMSHRIKHLPSQLSGGERQRIAIARALANAPKLIVADEPTGNLDETTGQRIIDTLLDLCRQRKTALILVTHNHTFASQTQQQFFLTKGVLLSCQKSNAASSEPAI